MLLIGVQKQALIFLLLLLITFSSISCSNGGEPSIATPTPTAIVSPVETTTANITDSVLDCNQLITPEKIGNDDFEKYGIAQKLEEDQFERKEIGRTVICWCHRMIGNATVEKDILAYYFSPDTGKLVDKQIRWRNDLPDQLPSDLITKEEAEAIVEGEVLDSRLYYISPDSDVYPLDPISENPCWIVWTLVNEFQAIKIIDAVTGEYLGEGISPP